MSEKIDTTTVQYKQTYEGWKKAVLEAVAKDPHQGIYIPKPTINDRMYLQKAKRSGDLYVEKLASGFIVGLPKNKWAGAPKSSS